MNNVILLGRISSEVKAKHTAKGSDTSCVLSFSLAVADRAKKDAEGNYETDFFKITTFGSIAECIEKYCSKGDRVLIRGKIKNNNYEKDGNRIYSTEIILSEIEFLETKKKDTEIPKEKAADVSKKKFFIRKVGSLQKTGRTALL